MALIPKRVIDLEREIRSALCKKNDVESAYKVLDEIPEMGLVPNLVMYTTILLYGCSFVALNFVVISEALRISPSVVAVIILSFRLDMLWEA
ncbi:hypothetical protein F2Q70_00006199 [Brassica cretica]|uniref:Uncharacterized protein n=1 Tax=Brassica cretica TaxID=69181 RepID=A0A8S9INF9_BRACR|nr:hypothetical protein F2Q70_00006199 [Brassica cretica]